LGAAGRAHHSGFLPSGFEQRLGRFAEALGAALKPKAKHKVKGAARGLAEAADGVLDHALAEHETVRVEGVEMAARLARWLVLRREGKALPAGSFANAARAYHQQGGHVDWARARIWEGDTLAPLGKVYAALGQAAASVREDENRRFGELLANWTKTGSHDASVIPVERFIERVAVPLATARPLLLVVIDGMGMGVFRELEDDLLRRGWAQIDTPGESLRLPVIAALPTVTEVSRTSLLCGAVTVGTSNDEKAGFANYPALMAVGARSKPPLLFHKGDLTAADSVGVAPPVLAAIADDKRRVVGVVINAVDDHLAKGDQLRVDWTVHRIKPLEELLAAARDAGRVLAMVSDHGHIAEHNTKGRPFESAERWREAEGPLQDDEVLLSGPRVMLGRGHKLIAPWSERVRYSGKKNGYHGGASPQEVVIPLGLFAPAGLSVDGWSEVGPDVPVWWNSEAQEPTPTTKPAKAVKPKPPAAPGEQGRLFPTEEEVAAATVAMGPEWIDRLMISEVMAAQRQMASRVALPEDRIRAILVALDERGGKLTRPALAKRIGVPPMRLGGVISALRRLLNVDGYAVLSVDDQADTVELNLKQLFTQFGLR
ncbi:MAG: BREX-2 system phosphatase PglZ, partial [Chromatiaceae bacterium]